MKQRLFCDYYLTHLNARKAYIEAGYAATSPEAARTHATELLNLRGVQEWLKAKMAERATRLSVQADTVLQELNMVAKARITDFRFNHITETIEIVPGVPEEFLKAVKSFKVTTKTRPISQGSGPDRVVGTETTRTTEIILHDKLKACQMLCEHLGLLSAELPPLEVLLNRLPLQVAHHLRELLKKPQGYRPPDNRDVGEPPNPAGTQG